MGCKYFNSQTKLLKYRNFFINELLFYCIIKYFAAKYAVEILLRNTCTYVYMREKSTYHVLNKSHSRIRALILLAAAKS